MQIDPASGYFVCFSLPFCFEGNRRPSVDLSRKSGQRKAHMTPTWLPDHKRSGSTGRSDKQGTIKVDIVFASVAGTRFQRFSIPETKLPPSFAVVLPRGLWCTLTRPDHG